MDDQQERLMDLFHEALAKSSAEEREAFLTAACAGDDALRRQVELLLQTHAQLGNFLQPPNDDPPENHQAGRIIGRYKLLEQIGEGGFGLVFMAEQLEPIRRKVALKLIKPGMDTKQVIARFEAERQALALLDHPNIAKILDAGTTGAPDRQPSTPDSRLLSGRPYFVMELVQGVPITHFCDANGLTPQERLKLFLIVCDAVQHAHQKGIIHRDLKPSNILVTLHDGKPVPKIIDFGTAKALQQPLTEKTLFTAYGKLIGTPQYMSPEQAELSGLDVDTRADIYSLGVLLYELLTGTTPFEPERLRAAAFEEMMRIIRQEEPPKPSTRVSTLGERATEIAKHRQVDTALLRRTLRGDLDWIVMKALEKDRTRRYATASALQEDLQRHIDHQPVQAGPPGAVYRMGKFVQRHRMGVALAASVTLALLVGLTVALVGFGEARRERAQAEKERDRAVVAERNAEANEQKAEQERNHAELLASDAALNKGQTLLEGGDSWGLWDMVKAFELAKHNPAFQETVGRRWSTWQTLWARRMIVLKRPPGGVHSPDYLQYVDLNGWPTFNSSNEINIYDTVTGARVSGPLRHESAAWGCAFGPDGHHLAVLTRKGVIHLWDCRTGKPARPPCETGVPELNQLAFSKDGRQLAAFSGEGMGPCSAKLVLIRLDAIHEPVRLLEHRYPVCRAQFSRDGEVLAVHCEPALQVWRTTDLQPIGPPLRISWSDLLVFNPDGTRLAFNPEKSGGISLLDPMTLSVILHLPGSYPGPITCAFSHDGKLLASLDWDCDLELWRPDAGSKPYAVQRLRGRASGLAFSPDDSLLAVGEPVGSVRVLRTSDGQVVHKLHTDRFPGVVFLANGVLAVDNGALMRLWDPKAKPLPESWLPHDALAQALEFDHTGAHLAVGSENEIRLWTMQPVPKLESVVPLAGRVLTLTYLKEESQFVAFTDDGSLTKLDPRTGRTAKVGNYGRGYGLSACLSPDARKLVLFNLYEGMIIDTRTGSPEQLDDIGGALSAAFRHDSQRLAVGRAWAVSLYDTSAPTNAPGGIGDGFEGWVESVAYHPGSRLLALCVNGQVIRLYEPEKKNKVFGAYETSLARVNLLRFSPDASLLAAAGPTSEGEHGIELWHTDPERGLHRSGLNLTSDHPIWSLAFSPDGRALLAGGLGSTCMWSLPSKPEDLAEVQAQTLATLGVRLGNDGQPVDYGETTQPIEEIRARLTQTSARSVPPLDAALKLPPTEALAGLQELAGQYPGANVFARLLGRLHAELMLSNAVAGLWTKALSHADQALRLGRDDPYLRYQRALLYLGAGDAAGYRAGCQAMMDRYHTSDDPAVIKPVAWTAALVPGALEDYTRLIEQLRRSLPRMTGSQSPDYRFYLAAVLVRAGRYEEAMVELERSGKRLETAAKDVEFNTTYFGLLRSICHSRLNQKEAARHWLDTAAGEIQSLLPDGRETADSTPAVDWNRRLTLQLLRQEAEALVNTS